MIFFNVIQRGMCMIEGDNVSLYHTHTSLNDVKKL